MLVSYKWSIKWKSPFSRTQFISSSYGSIELLTYNIDWKPTRKNIKIPDNEVVEKVLEIIKPKLSNDLGGLTDSMQELHKIKAVTVKKGWLVKCGAKVHSWKRRWMVLQNGEISYSKTEEGNRIGTIQVNGSKIINVDINNRKYVFSVVTEKRTYHIQAENEHEKQSWTAACVQHGGVYTD